MADRFACGKPGPGRKKTWALSLNTVCRFRVFARAERLSCIYTHGRADGETGLIKIRGLERQRVQQVGRQGRREGPGTAGAPGTAAAAASASVGRAAVAGAVPAVFHVHQVLVGDRLDLVRRQDAVRATGWRRRTPRRASLRLDGAGHGTGRAAVDPDAALRRRLLLGQSFLLAKLRAPILEPYLQHRHGWPTMLGPFLLRFFRLLLSRD